MGSSNLINIVLFLYLFSIILYIASTFKWKRSLDKAVIGAFCVCAVLQSMAFFQRWIASGHPPLSGMYDSLMLFSLALIVSYLVFTKFYKINGINILISILEVIFISYANMQDKSIMPLVPVLKSNWLVFHVFVYMIGYGLMTVAFFTAIGYFWCKLIGKENKLELTDSFNKITYKIVSVGFPMITLGIITGAVWANRTWGSYWSWDPKETSALITWLIYAIYLHFTYMKIGKNKINILPILGFIAIIITFLFLRYIPAAKDSLHIYQ